MERLLDSVPPEELDRQVKEMFGTSQASTAKPFVHPNDRTIDEKMVMLAPQLRTNKTADIISIDEYKRQTKSRHAESDLQTLICRWIVKTYPGTIFVSDFAAGMKLSPFLANLRKSQSSEYKYPDLTICEPRGGYFGLYIEIKAEGSNPFRQDGQLKAGEHLAGQNKTLERLRDLGYLAHFGCGEDQIKRMITKYMKMDLTRRMI